MGWDHVKVLEDRIDKLEKDLAEIKQESTLINAKIGWVDGIIPRLISPDVIEKSAKGPQGVWTDWLNIMDFDEPGFITKISVFPTDLYYSDGSDGEVKFTIDDDKYIILHSHFYDGGTSSGRGVGSGIVVDTALTTSELTNLDLLPDKKWDIPIDNTKKINDVIRFNKCKCEIRSYANDHLSTDCGVNARIEFFINSHIIGGNE